MGIEASLYGVTMVLLTLKFVFGMTLCWIILRRASWTSQHSGQPVSEEVWSSAAVMFAIGLVSIADIDLLRDTHNVEWWRTMLRSMAFFVEVWVLSLLWRAR